MSRRRRGWKRGDWLVRDEESGFVEYASRLRRDYYGVLKLKKEADPVHPQDFVKAKQDPYIASFPQNPPEITYDTSAYNLGDFVGLTSVTAPFGPATHLYNPSAIAGEPGIGDMEIGTTFTVR